MTVGLKVNGYTSDVACFWLPWWVDKNTIPCGDCHLLFDG